MNKILRYVLVTLGFALVIWLMWYLRSVVFYIIVAGFVNLVGSPLVNLLARIHIKGYYIPRWVGAALTLSLFWFVVLVFFSIFIPILVAEANELSAVNVNAIVENLKIPLNRFQQFLESYNLQLDKNFDLKQYAIDKLALLFDISRISGIFRSIAGMFGDIFIAIFSISFISFFFLKEERMFPDFIRLLIPSGYEQSIMNVFQSINRLLTRYFLGISLEVFFVMLLNALGLSLVGLEPGRALIIAMFAGIMNVVPYIGPLIGIIFGTLMGMATHLQYDFYTELMPLLGLMLIVFVSVQVIDNTVFQPLIYSSSVNAHPLEIFLIILIAGNLAGILGMVLAIPIYTIIRVVAKEFFNNYKLVKKLTAKM